MKYIGKMITYTTHGEYGINRRRARIEKIEFNEQIGKPLFICKSAFGNVIRLTRNEIILPNK